MLAVTDAARGELDRLQELLKDAIDKVYEDGHERGLRVVSLVLTAALADCGGGFGLVGVSAMDRDLRRSPRLKDWLAARLLERAAFDLSSAEKAN